VEEALVGSAGNLASREEVDEEIRVFDQGLETGADLGIGEEAEEGVDDGFMGEEQPGRKDKVEL
jgi:large subunit ribosomal protein L28